MLIIFSNFSHCHVDAQKKSQRIGKKIRMNLKQKSSFLKAEYKAVLTYNMIGALHILFYPTP